ncbi:MAG: bifunctional oligoribonuclease/PAP phosphatase NrnA [Bacteroidota bacterium]
MASEINAVKELLAQPRDIVIFSHRNPDGDAIGSSLGLFHYLRRVGHSVHIIVPSGYPDFLSWLPGVDQVVIFDDETQRAKQLVDRAGMFFLLDFNSFERIDKLGELVMDDKRPKVMIDHHLYPEPVADYMFSDPSASSTCEMVYTFISDLGHEGRIDPTIGDCLYTGIITDTGGFKYATSPRLFQIASKLLAVGTDDYRVQDQIWNSMTEKQLRLLGHCLANRMEVYPEFHTGLIYLTKQDYADFDIKRGDTEGIVNYLLRMPQIMIAAFIHEQPTIVKLSLRSKGDLDVQQICKEHFRGGGHKNAAGGASFKPLNSTIRRFVDLLPDYAEQIRTAYQEFHN